MLEQFPPLVSNRLNNPRFDMWSRVIVMKDDVVLFSRTLGLDSCMKTVELSQINVAVYEKEKSKRMQKLKLKMLYKKNDILLKIADKVAANKKRH